MMMMIERISRARTAILAAFVLLATGISGLMTETAFAQIDRTRQPEADPAPKAIFPPFDVFTLKNGLKVYFVHDPRPVVTFRLQVRGGQATDGDLPGLSAAASELLTKGTKDYTAQQFAEKIDFVGGSVSGGSSSDMVTVGASGLRKFLPTILDLFAEAIKFPTYPADELGKYKQEQITGIKAQSADAGTLANNAVNLVLFGRTPYGLTPTEESISRLTTDMLAKYHKTWFTPSNSTLAVVGDFEINELKQKLEAAFGDWAKGKSPALATPKFPVLKGRRIVLVDRPASVQSSIRVIGRGPLYKTENRPVSTILNSIIGGGGLSDRLTMNLRETHSYTYTPYSYFAANLYQGYWVAGADVRNEVTDSALTEILSEIQRIQSEDVPAEELNRHVQSSIGRFLMSIADPNTTAERIQFLEFYGLPRDYYNRLIGIYTGTNAKQIRALAKQYLEPKDLAVVVVGKASDVKEKLEKFGTVEVWDTDMNPVGATANGAVRVAAPSISGEELWSKMIEARGGLRKLQAVTSLKTTGAVDFNAMGQSLQGTVTNISKAPNKRYISIEINGMGKLIESISNGTRSVQRQMGQQKELQGAELEAALESARILGEAWAHEMNGKLASRAGKVINGVQTIGLELTLPKSGTTVYYLDPKTWLPVRTESAEGMTVTMADWYDAGEGVMLPHTMTLEPAPNVSIKMTGLKNEINAQVDEAIFSPK